MPQNGHLTRHLQAIEFELGVRPGPLAEGGTGIYGAKLISWWCPDVLTMAPAFDIVYLENAAAGTWQFKYDGPFAPFGGYVFSGTGINGAHSMRLRFPFSLYARAITDTVPASFKLFLPEIEIYVDGALVQTLSGPVTEFDSAAFNPTSIYPWAGLLQMTSPGDGDGASTGPQDMIVSGGYRYHWSSGAYEAPAVLLPTTFEPGLTVLNINKPPTEPPDPFQAPLGLSLPDCLLSTATYGDHLRLSSWEVLRDEPVTWLEYQRRGGHVWLVPNLPRNLRRFGIEEHCGFEGLALNSPEIRASGVRTATLNDKFGTGGRTEAVYPAITGGPGWFAQEIDGGESDSDWERSSRAPVYAFCFTEISVCDSPYTAELVQFEFPSAVLQSNTGPMWHLEVIPRAYQSPWYHPWFLNRCYLNRNNLTVDGTVRKLKDYWYPIRSQMMPVSQRRNSIYACSLDESPWTPWYDFYLYGNPETEHSGARPVGICRFDVQNVTPPSSVQMDDRSAALLQKGDPGDSVVFVGDEIRYSGTAAGRARFRVKLRSLSSWPYLYGLNLGQVRLTWEPLTTGEVRAWWVNSLTPGDRVPLKMPGGSEVLSPGTTFEVPRATDSKYVGSWSVDNGNDPPSGVTDVGADADGDGASAMVAISVERATGFGLHGEGQPLLLEIEFDYGATPAIFDWPLLYRSTGPRLVAPEKGNTVMILHEDGPALRIGEQNFAVDPPVVSGLGFRQTAEDILKLRRLLWDPAAMTSGLVAERDSMFDTFEVRNWVNTTGIVLPTTNSAAYHIATLNLVREPGALLAYPHPSRNATTYQPEPPLTNEVWIWSTRPRLMACPGTVAPSLVDESDAVRSSTSSLATIDGWAVAEADPQLDNTETDWRIELGGRALALVRPWHGYLMVDGRARPPVPAGVKVRCFERLDGPVYALIAGEDQLSLLKIFGDLRETYQILGQKVVGCAGCWETGDFGQRMSVFYVPDGETNLYEITSRGRENAWSSPTMIGAAEDVAVVHVRKTGITVLARYASGAWVTQHRKPGGAWVTGSPIATVALGSCDMAVETGSRSRIIAVVSDGSTANVYESVDHGQSWSLES